MFNRFSRIFISTIFLLFSFSSCDDSGYQPPPPIDGGLDASDIEKDHTVPPDIPDADPEGPEIVITEPVDGTNISGDVMQVKATVSSASSTVDFEAVNVILEGSTYTMTVDPLVENGFMATVNLAGIPDGDTVLRVTAQDIEGRTGYEDVTFNYDNGPVITVSSPIVDENYHGGTNLSFSVYDNDGVNENAIYVFVGNVPIEITKTDESSDSANGMPLSISYTSQIMFDDNIFMPALDGPQRISIHAENGLGNSSDKSVDFNVDNEGPSIDVTSQTPGQLIGSIIDIVATISDPSGVLDSSVYAIIGNNDTNYVVALSSVTGSTTYSGSFDTSVLPSSFIWPAIQVFASDKLNNEASVAFEVALDNQSPLASLDPPDNFRLGSENADNTIDCSFEFDPVGNNAVNDLATAAQVFWIRARIEDRGNSAYGTAWTPTALVDRSRVELYILDDVSEPLTVDTNDDGFCDDINPELLPTIHLTGNPLETLKLDMVALDPDGAANFMPDPTALGAEAASVGCESEGSMTEPPEPLCPAVTGDMTVTLWYTYDQQEPSIYSLPPYDKASPYQCTGIQFDSWANNISEGWACVAVKTTDNVGNEGVSAPLRVCIEYNYDPANGPQTAECQNINNAPDCTGSVDNSTNPPTITSVPCTSYIFPDAEMRRVDVF